MSKCKSIEEFRAKYGEEFFEEFVEWMCDAVAHDLKYYNKNKTIYISEIEKRGPLQYYIRGAIELPQQESVGFLYYLGGDMGDDIDFGEKHFEIPEPNYYYFDVKPVGVNELDDLTKLLIKTFFSKLPQEILDKEKSMNYDLFFDCATLTRKHYEDFAAKRGLVIRRGTLSDREKRGCFDE